MNCSIRRATLFVFLTVAFSSTLWGQANTASIRGIVTDPSGGVIVGAQVTLVNTGTGVQSVTKTNPAGEYLFEFLSPGTYKIEVHFAGFKTFTRENIGLDLARQLRIDVGLEPGQVTETINVEAQAPVVDTENGALGTTVQNQMVTELPLLTRNPQSLELLGAGVIQNPNGNITNGGLVRIDPYYIDGADSSNHVWSGTPVNPNPDVINEFRALTNAYSAEYGESSGVTMIATTKSGTNSFHGSAFEFLQNDDLNAGNYFTHSVPLLRFNQFGGTFGGPIKKNKLFFFVDTQITRQKNPQPITNITVPTAAFRSGDFSSILGGPVGTDALGRTDLQYEIFNPFTQRQITVNGNSVWVRDPFPGNIIPASLISPAAQKIQALYPAPLINQPFNNFSVNGAALTQLNEWDVKVDYAISDLDRLAVRDSNKQGYSYQASAFGYAAGGGPVPGTLGPGNYIAQPGHQAVLNYVHVFGPTATNDLNIAWQNQFPRRVIPGYGQISNNDLGIYGMPNGGQKLGTPYFLFTNFEQLGATTDTTFQEWQTQETLSDTFSWSKGRHNIRIGGWFRRLLTNNLQPGALNTAWSFTNVFTNQPGNNNTGFDYASFLLGLPNSLTYSIYPDFFRTRANLYAAFVQDDFHVSRNLTLNLGLRWDAPNFFHEAQNRSGVFSLTQGQYIQFGVNGFRTTPWNNDWANFDPRFGFAYSPLGGKLVIRGGYGIFVAGVSSAGANGFMLNSPIFADSDQGRYTTTDQIHWLATLDNIPYQPIDRTGRNSKSVTIFPNDNPMAYIQQYNTNVQYEFKTVLFQAGYVGTRGSHLTYGGYNLNAIPIGVAPQAQGQFAAPYVPYPQYPLGVNVSDWIGSSDYNALQAKAERRFANGLAFVVNFTHSKMIDTGNWGYRDPVGNRSLDRGISQYDAPNRFVAGYNYQLPIGPGRKWLSKNFIGNIIGGWEFNGITTYQTGLALSPGLSVNNCVCGNSRSAPNVTGNPMTGPQSLNQWFNRSVFSFPAQYTIGNAGVGLIYGPHLWSTDLNTGKRFPLPWREGMNLEFRAEFYNVFNHPNFSPPDVNLGDANFGKVTAYSALVNPRKGQVALKLYF
jgi:Carboxypeptidase regulatory-like domain